MIRAASMCSGIGAPETALPGWDWVWSAEIEPFPSRVLAARSPHSINLGDLTASDFCERARALGRLDVIIAGTPCQDFSIAGLRAGLNGERGNIMLRALQIYEDQCHAARLAGQPEPVFWWENVRGVLSDKTNAFGCLLAGLAGSADTLVPPSRCGWTDAGVVTGPARNVAWRVLDAQYFGVPQRRERVFVMAGSRTGAFDPAAVFLEHKSLRGDIATGGKARKGVARSSRRSTQGGYDHGRGAGIAESPHICPTLQAGGNLTGGNRPPGTTVDTCESLVPVYAIQERAVAENPSAGPDGKGWQEGLAFTLEARSQVQAVASSLRGQKNSSHRADMETFVPVAFGGGNRAGAIDVAACLTAKGMRQDFEVETFVAEPLAFDCKSSGQNGFGVGSIASTMRSMGHAGSHQNGGGHLAVVASHAVRRLMPIECERLQGFPDFHTDIPNGDRPAADGPRYKALGNSMAVPVIRWLGGRIEAQLEQR